MNGITIIGASGYTGAELVRLISNHPNFNIAHLVSSSSDDAFSDLYPSLLGREDKHLEPFNIPLLDKDTDAYVTALPHGKSMEIIAELYKNTKKPIVDLGADFRYKNIKTYEKWYNLAHTAADIPSVYGLCELNREKIKSSRLIGNPGCYTTCSILALSPLVASGIINNSSIIIDAKSGTTGAGKKLSVGTHFCTVNESMKAYSIGTHRHTSEIEEQLSQVAGEEIILNFTPHLLPINRGIIATCYADLEDENTAKELIDLYRDYYKGEGFIKIMDQGKLPELNYVVGSNNCYIGLTVDVRTKRVIVVSCIDNLIKGASGQAIQNLNLLFDLDETAGLNMPGWYL